MSTIQNRIPEKYVIPAHEIGHNFGANHPHEVNPSVEGCTNTLMSVVTSGGGSERQLTFCQFSRQEIADYVSGNNHCLTSRPISLQPPSGLLATATSESRIHLAWQDNSTNEMGFLVQRRQEGSGVWVPAGRTAADAETFSDGELFSSTTYIYRVQAFNDVESSAFSNEAAATTRTARETSSGWIIDTIVGGRNNEGDNGPAVAARLNDPSGVAVDSAGNLYIADSANNRIRRVDAFGAITTVAGTRESGYSGDGGPAVEAALNNPADVAVDGAGNLYFTDGSRIRRVDRSGTIATIAGLWEHGNFAGYSGDGGPAVAARLYNPKGVVVDSAGNLFIADSSNHRIRRVDTEGTITTVAGTGKQGYSGDGGPAVAARLNSPGGLAVDATGNLYFGDYSKRLRRVDRSGTITTVAGTGERGFSGDGGPAVAARLGQVSAVAVDGKGNLYFSDIGNHRVRRVDRSGIITTVAGIGLGDYYPSTGPAVEVALDGPHGLAVDRAGNLYIADSFYNHIRRVDASGTISIIAGTGIRGYSGDGGSAKKAQLFYPRGLGVDNAGNIYVGDTSNHRVRVVARPLRSPTRLTATADSPSRIKLAWQDNSANEIEFRVQRQIDGLSDWVEIGTTAANVTTYTDTGLAPTTTYGYRIRALVRALASGFSNEARATTLEAPPPTLTRFTPTTGPAGTRVTLTGTHFLGATDVRFNGVSAVVFEVLSGTNIEAVVPRGAIRGPISVVTPGGTAVSAEPFTVTTGIGSRLFVPVVLRSQGRTPGSFFTSEMTLTNRGSTTAEIHYTYRASFGVGSGTAVDFLEAGRQRIVPDAIAYLTSLGIPIGEGAAGGTLVVDFSNLSSESATAVTVRTSTPVEDGRGQAGLAYLGVTPEDLLTSTSVIAGLRQNRMDRSNVAVQNAGVSGEERITLRVTVYSGDPEAPGSLVLPDRTLPPGGFHQYNRILNMAGFDNGYVKVERVEGTAPFYAYGVINDNFNSDGSFVFPLTESSLVGTSGQTLPVILETGAFTSELTVTNFSPVTKTVGFRFVAEAVETDDDTASFSLKLKAGEQQILPRIIDWLREQGVAGIGPADEPFVGALFATAAEGDMSGIVIGARTGSPDKRGRQYSLFYNGVPYGSASIESAWIYGLQQNAENRSNLALVNTGEIDDSSSTFEITIYDGSGNTRPRTKSVTLGPRRWTQGNGILGKFSQGYVEVRKTSGSNPFVTYGVINDGGRPGQRSGDGAFLLSQE